MSKKVESFSWGELEVKQVALLDKNSVKAVSNGPALSILFDKATVSLQGSDGPRIATWVASLSVPMNITGDPQSMYFRELLRGFVRKDEQSRVLVVFDVGGQVYYRDHQYGPKIENDLVLESAFRVTGKARDTYAITLFIVIEGATQESSATVVIDSIDIEASFQQLGLSERPPRRSRESNQ